MVPFRLRFLAAPLLLAVAATGCAASGSEDDPSAAGAGAISGQARSDAAVVYFHGMSHLGLPTSAIRAQVGSDDVLTPSLSDAELSAPPSKDVYSFLEDRTSGVVGGYSLGRVLVLKLMQAQAPGMTRVVMIDPTYDSASGFAKGSGGKVARAWLDGDKGRTLFFVYGDVTTELAGDRSYLTALGDDERAVLCHVPGDHERFRQPDVAYALVARDCDDLKAHLQAQTASAEPDDPLDSTAAASRDPLADGTLTRGLRR